MFKFVCQVGACGVSKHRYLGSRMSNLGSILIGLRVVMMVTRVVNTRVVIGVQMSLSSSMGMLHVKP